MSWSVDELINNAVEALDTAYAANPTGDTDAMITSALTEVSTMGDMDVLTFLGTTQNYADYIDQGAVDTANANILATVTDAVNAELLVLQGS